MVDLGALSCDHERVANTTNGESVALPTRGKIGAAIPG
jgi:hypothetical protein